MLEREMVHRMIDSLYEIRKLFQESANVKVATQHFNKAKKEGLLGIRALLDQAIKEVKAEEKTNVKKKMGKKS